MQTSHPHKNRIRKYRGGALIEFVIIIPILVLLMIGILEASIMLYDKAMITNASREGARYGIVKRIPTYATMTDVQNYTKTYLQNNLISFSKTPTLTVTATSSTNPPAFESLLTVTVSYTYTYLALWHFLGINQTATISSTTVMSYE